mgnify:CR=1 FL=1
MITLIFKNKKHLRYGKGDKGVLIPPDQGRRGVFVPSFGAMEKEEIEEVVLAAQEKEDGRIKKRQKSAAQEKLEQVLEQTLKAEPGERAKTAREIIEAQETRWI